MGVGVGFVDVAVFLLQQDRNNMLKKKIKNEKLYFIKYIFNTLNPDINLSLIKPPANAPAKQHITNSK